MEKNEMKDLTILVSKTGRAMILTRRLQKEIDDLKEVLMNETRPMMVEEWKKEIEVKENEKKEYDEMTKAAIIRAKTEILKLREESEKEYQNKLIENVEKQKRIEAKLKSIEGKEQDEEKLSMARRSAEKALTNVKEEMKSYEERHFSEIRPKLNELEAKIGDYAIELGIEEELNKVGLEKFEKELDEVEEEKTETVKEEKLSEPVKIEEEETEPVKVEGEKEKPVEVKKPEPVKTQKREPKSKAKIESIEFVFDSGEPKYIIKTTDGAIIEKQGSEKYYRPFTEEKAERFDNLIGFKGASKIADRSLIAILRDYDKEKGTSEEKRYLELITDAYKKNLKEEKGYLDITYNMNGKHEANMNKKAVKNLNKIAKRNERYFIADYIKNKGIIARLIEKYFKTPKLEGEKDEKTKYNEEPVLLQEELEHYSEETLSVEDAYKHYIEESKTPGFDKVTFYKQLQRGGYTDSELRELRGKIEGEKGLAHRHDNEFKANLRKQAEQASDVTEKQPELEESNSKGKKLFGGKEGKFSKPRQTKESTKIEEFTVEEVKEQEEVR